MNADAGSAEVHPVYRSRPLRGGRGSPRRLKATTEAAEESEDSARPYSAALSDVDRRALARLNLAVAELFNAVSSALQERRDTAQECVQRARAILGAEPLRQLSRASISARQNRTAGRNRGGLAPWRSRQVIAFIESNLDGTIRTKDLAAIVRLSSFHFCRAFRESFSDSPHVYLMRRRIERAQELMLTTSAPLGQIAADCGLADQPHFNKLFRRFVGDSPGAWRRARATTPAQI
jgi:AraC family transcriptional regulator